MKLADGTIFRRTERWVVGLAMAALALLIEGFIVRAMRRAAKRQGSGQPRN
ncbi:MAG: hypothetical protein ACM3PU_09090 [Gemmatimonadota bacterium]